MIIQIEEALSVKKLKACQLHHIKSEFPIATKLDTLLVAVVIFYVYPDYDCSQHNTDNTYHESEYLIFGHICTSLSIKIWRTYASMPNDMKSTYHRYITNSAVNYCITKELSCSIHLLIQRFDILGRVLALEHVSPVFLKLRKKDARCAVVVVISDSSSAVSHRKC